jgi:hypothetical protein
MRLLQSYWSLPSLLNKENESYGRNKGGWQNERSHAMSWALSCLRLKQLYGQIVLYTDSAGLDWMGNRLDLPYSEIIVELDALNAYNPMLWTLPKIYVYGKQNEPFIHCDGDVFMWKRLSPQMECSELICQNFEINSPHYIESLKQINQVFVYIPDCLRILQSEQEQLISINAGVIGGVNYAFFRDFSANVFSFIQMNLSVLDKINVGNFNLVCEQLFIYRLSNQCQVKITPLLLQVSEEFEEVIRVNITPMFNSYAHTVGNSKQNLVLCMEIEARLKYEFPLVHQHISKLYAPVISHAVDGLKTDEPAATETSAFGHSRGFISRVLLLDNIASEAITNLVETISENAVHHSKDESLLLDLYQIESAWQELDSEQKDGKQRGELLMEKIYSGLDVLYGHPDSFLQTCFVLDIHSYRIIGIYHQFERDVEHQYLSAIASGEVLVAKSDNAAITLVEHNASKINLTRLEGWDLLLYYFEEHPLTGSQLIDLIREGQTPFSADEDDIENDVVNFLINNAFNLRRLRCVRPAEV